MATPEVSVICPVYKRTKFLGAVMDGMLGQTFSNWELIFVDDGSNMPEVTEICRRYEEQDSRVKYLQLEKNVGSPGARNAGIAESSAEFIALNDDDDYHHPQWLEKLTGFLRQHPDIAAVDCMIIGINEDGKVTHKNDPGTISPEPLIFEASPPHAPLKYMYSSVMRRSCFIALGGYNTDYKTAEDVELTLRLQEKYRFAFWREELRYYRRHNSGAAHLSRRSDMWKYAASAHIAAYCRRNNLAAPSAAVASRELMAQAPQLPPDVLDSLFKTARGGCRRLLRHKHARKDFEEMLGDIQTAFLHNKKYRRKLYPSLLAWAFWYGRWGSLPVIVKSMV